MQPIVLYVRLLRRIENLQESAIVRLINCKIIFNRILSRHFLKLYLLKSIMVGNKMIKRILYGNSVYFRHYNNILYQYSLYLSYIKYDDIKFRTMIFFSIQITFFPFEQSSNHCFIQSWLHMKSEDVDDIDVVISFKK